MIKILIGTPIRDIKSYSMDAWLESVKEQDIIADLYMVDNSDAPDFYRKYKRKGYDVDRIEYPAGRNDDDRLSRSREMIRKRFIKGNYDIWFSWECDIILPKNTYSYLSNFLNDFDIINHDYPSREHPDEQIGGIGCTIVKKWVMDAISFTAYGGYGQCYPKNPNCYYGNEGLFFTLAVENGAKALTIHNKLDIKHLAEIGYG